MGVISYAKFNIDWFERSPKNSDFPLTEKPSLTMFSAGALTVIAYCRRDIPSAKRPSAKCPEAEDELAAN